MSHRYGIETYSVLPEDHCEFQHLPKVTEQIVDVDRKKSTTLRMVLRKVGSGKQENGKQIDWMFWEMGYNELLWPYRDKQGRWCFATSCYQNMGHQGAALIRIMQEYFDHDKFTLEHYQFPNAPNVPEKDWIYIKSGNIHRDHVYIARSK